MLIKDGLRKNCYIHILDTFGILTQVMESKALVRLIYIELFSPETVPMAAIIHPLLRGLHHVYLNLIITYIVFFQISVLEIYEWNTFMVITIIHY